MDVDFPLHVDGRGQTASTDDLAHIRSMVEQVLFTSPGERVNRPTFGSGALQLVFAPNADEAAAAIQLQVHGALQQWLGDLIEVQQVLIDASDSTLRVAVAYVVRATQTQQVAEFARPGAQR